MKIMISVQNLTKQYGSVLAVDSLNFEVLPGRITGFLGPNGSGKSTTMRMILGLDHPTHGEATITGKKYRDIAEPLKTVGALLDAEAMHAGLVVLQLLGEAAHQREFDLLGLGHDRLPKLT